MCRQDKKYRVLVICILLRRETYVNIAVKEVRYDGKEAEGVFGYICHKLSAARGYAGADERHFSSLEAV